ncbi:hypothetical protein WMY93_026273 [Mugilogobius chulae]|uniref:Immunoglobulin subtype domain-containing protein n=1 Tax=Mugilogobius chulae TaxID=88201 RepID=A0AAW0MWZ6_9GOBI
MLKGGQPVPLSGRFQVSGSTVSVKSAVNSDSGWYRCKYSLGGSQQRCMEIKLQVQDKFPAKFTTTQATQDMKNSHIPHDDSEEGFSAVHTIAVLVGVFVIAALVGAIFYWKHNKMKASQETPHYEGQTGSSSAHFELKWL